MSWYQILNFLPLWIYALTSCPEGCRDIQGILIQGLGVDLVFPRAQYDKWYQTMAPYNICYITHLFSLQNPSVSQL